METNDNVKKKAPRKFIIVLTIIIVVILLEFGYSRYMASVNGNVTGTVAGYYFNVTVNSEENLNIDLGQTRTQGDTTKVASGDVAPRNKRSFYFKCRCYRK